MWGKGKTFFHGKKPNVGTEVSLPPRPPSFFKKSEVWLLQTCPAIAYGDGGLSQQDLLRRRMVALLSLINYRYWEQSYFFQQLMPTMQ